MTTEQMPDDDTDLNSEYAAVYQTMYTTAYIEREEDQAYNAEELLLEVV